MSNVTHQPIEELHTARVAQFASLYDAVTKEMERFRDTPDKALTQREREWLTGLIAGFQERFAKWVPEEADYLQSLYGQNWDIITVIGLAYLHINYDLPLVIAESLAEQGRAGEQPLDSSRGYQIYSALEGGFSAAANSNWSKPWLLRVVLWIPEAEPVFTNWLVGLRNRAWIDATLVLALKSDAEKQQFQDRLHAAIGTTMQSALKHRTPWWPAPGLDDTQLSESSLLLELHRA